MDMKTFQEYLLADEHQHNSFDKAYACFMMYIGRQNRKGKQEVKVSIEDCRQVYKEMQYQGTASQAQDSATRIVRNAISKHTDGTINTQNNDSDSLDRPRQHASYQAKNVTPRDAPNDRSEENNKRRRVAYPDDADVEQAVFGSQETSHSSISALSDIENNIPDIPPPVYPHMHEEDLLPSDPTDFSSVDQEDPSRSPSILYTWDFMDGPGRVDSNVDSFWTHNGTCIGRDLIAFRNRVVENNGGLSESHEKLAINFVFLVEAEYQTGGLQGEVEDNVWDSLCDAVRDPVPSLSKDAVDETHQWAHRLAQHKPDAFMQLLDDTPQQLNCLKSVLRKMTDTVQLWNTCARNEDTYLKAQLGPFLDTFFGKIRFTKSSWTSTQDDTRGTECRLLIPDYSTTTHIGKQQLSVVLLEGKTVKNRGHSQIWDDLTKLGQEMKLALDSILKFQPENDVCV
ncbi:hypothetical protein BGW38_006431, partial [Lunasporangiospora selenospora]